MKRLQLLLTIALFFFYSPKASASHLLGGEITWECDPSGKFIFQMSLYCACYLGSASCPISASIANPLYVQYGGAATISLPRIAQSDLNDACYDPLQSIACGLTISSGGLAAIQENVYRSQPTQLNGIPDQSGSMFNWSSCCRPVSNNINGSSFFLRAVMFPYKPSPGGPNLSIGSASGGPTCYDASPQFVSRPLAAVCDSTTAALSMFCSDHEGDSLHYEWSTALQSSTTSITWQTGFNVNSQFPNSFHNANNIPATLGQTNGLITFKSYQPVGGYNYYCIKVTSYKQGQKVAEVYRDLPVVLFDCPPANFKKNIPSIDLKPALTSLFRQSFDTTIEAGALLELDLRALDSDTLSNPPLHYESITLEVLGRRAMSSTPNNSVACANPPCAYLDSVGNGSWVDSMNAFIDTSKVEARFFWQTGCEHAYTSGNPFGSWPRKSTYTFVIKAFDNRCPLPSVSFKAFNITVYDSTNIPWQIKGVDASTGGAKLDWNNYNLTNFNAYYLYRREIGTAPWNLLNTFTNVNTTNYHDQTALTDQKRYEYVMQVNDPDVCKNGGQVQNVYLTGNLQFNQWIKLNWNRPQSFAGASGNYEVYRKFGNGTWNNIASMSYGTETYTDKPTWQSFYVYYRVDGTDSEGLVTSSNVLTMEVDTPWIGLPEIHEPVVEIIPNPFKNELNIIDMDESLLGQKLTVYNMLGEKVQSHLVTSDRMSFDVSSVKAGVYFVHFTDRNGKSATRRLVKME